MDFEAEIKYLTNEVRVLKERLGRLESPSVIGLNERKCNYCNRVYSHTYHSDQRDCPCCGHNMFWWPYDPETGSGLKPTPNSGYVYGSEPSGGWPAGSFCCGSIPSGYMIPIINMNLKSMELLHRSGV